MHRNHILSENTFYLYIAVYLKLRWPVGNAGGFAVNDPFVAVLKRQPHTHIHIKPL
jgi:hypothetical protein